MAHQRPSTSVLRFLSSSLAFPPTSSSSSAWTSNQSQRRSFLGATITRTTISALRITGGRRHHQRNLHNGTSRPIVLLASSYHTTCNPPLPTSPREKNIPTTRRIQSLPARIPAVVVVRRRRFTVHASNINNNSNNPTEKEDSGTTTTTNTNSWIERSFPLLGTTTTTTTSGSSARDYDDDDKEEEVLKREMRKFFSFQRRDTIISDHTTTTSSSSSIVLPGPEEEYQEGAEEEEEEEDTIDKTEEDLNVNVNVEENCYDSDDDELEEEDMTDATTAHIGIHTTNNEVDTLPDLEPPPPLEELPAALPKLLQEKEWYFGVTKRQLKEAFSVSELKEIATYLQLFVSDSEPKSSVDLDRLIGLIANHARTLAKVHPNYSAITDKQKLTQPAQLELWDQYTILELRFMCFQYGIKANGSKAVVCKKLAKQLKMVTPEEHQVLELYNTSRPQITRAIQQLRLHQKKKGKKKTSPLTMARRLIRWKHINHRISHKLHQIIQEDQSTNNNIKEEQQQKELLDPALDLQHHQHSSSSSLTFLEQVLFYREEDKRKQIWELLGEEEEATKKYRPKYLSDMKAICRHKKMNLGKLLHM